MKNNKTITLTNAGKKDGKWRIIEGPTSQGYLTIKRMVGNTVTNEAAEIKISEIEEGS